MLDTAGQKELLDHVQDEQGLHTLEGNAIPHFGRGNERHAARVAKQQTIAATLFQISTHPPATPAANHQWSSEGKGRASAPGRPPA
jgi:hypothetical protein